MGRYTEKYWTQGIGIHLPGDDDELYGCEIIDSETGLVGSTNRWRSSKAKAYGDAWEDLMQKQNNYYNTPKTRYSESTSNTSSYSSSTSDQSGITAIAWLIGIVIAVFVVIWLAVNVVLPVALLNSALGLVVLALVFKKYKTLFASLALVGGSYMLFDITNGWLSVKFVEKVVKNPELISAFIYINAIAIGLSTWLLIQPIWLKTDQMEPAKKRKGLLIKSLLILVVVFFTSIAPIIYSSVQNPFVQKSIRFNKVAELFLGKNKVMDIDGNIYHTVTIGSQVWMIENLKTTKYNDGTSIPYVTENAEWANTEIPGYCWYNNDAINKVTYGGLYNWYAVNTGKLAPKGWHVPTYDDWTTLITFLGGDNVAGGKLKEKGTIHWKSPNNGATNETNFAALPGGSRISFDTRYDDGTFNYMGNGGYYYCSSETGTNNAWSLGLYYGQSDVTNHNLSRQQGLSVRCIKGDEPTIFREIKPNIDGHDKLKIENTEGEVGVTTLSNIEIKKWSEKPKDIIIDKPILYKDETNNINNSDVSLNQQEETNISENDDPPYNVVEQMPEFPGGEVGLNDFLNKSVKYPSEAAKMGIEGKVYVNFVVTKHGTIINSKVVRGVDPLLDAEALRVVKSFPKWIPGKQNGEVVKVSFTIPVNFKLK